MRPLVLAALVAIPVFVQLLLAAAVYYDARDLGLNQRKWGAIVLLIPVYGAIVYLLTRSELDYDPDTDPYRGGKVNVHPSRADEVPWDVRTPEDQPGAVPREAVDDGVGDGEATTDGRKWGNSSENEWPDPPGVDLEDERDESR